MRLFYRLSMKNFGIWSNHCFSCNREHNLLWILHSHKRKISLSSKEKLLACFPAFDTLEDLLDTTDLIQLPDLLLTRPKALVNSLKHSLNYKFLLKQKQTKEGGGRNTRLLGEFSEQKSEFSPQFTWCLWAHKSASDTQNQHLKNVWLWAVFNYPAAKILQHLM